MNARTRRAALYAIGAVALLASVDALAHSYAGLYGWALHHRLGGWQAWSWPAEIDVFLVVGELALYVAYLDNWPARQRCWPWLTAAVGLAISVAGNIGHVQVAPGAPVSLTDRLTAAISPVAAFAGLMIGLLVLKMSGHQAPVATGEQSVRTAGTVESDADKPEQESDVLSDAARIVEAAFAAGETISQRTLAAQLRGLGHRFSNAQLRSIAAATRGPGRCQGG